MKESLTLLVLIVAGMACTLGCLGLWSARTAGDRRCWGTWVALSLAVSLVAVGRWQQANSGDVLSWWLVLLALPALWPATAPTAARTDSMASLVAEEPSDA